MDADHFAEGIADANQALALDPKSIRAFHDIGIANAYSGDWAEALANMQRALSLDKNLANTQTAIKWVKAFQKQATTDPKAMQAWLLVHDADVAIANQTYKNAIATANQVISLEPAWPEGYDRLGLALGGADRWQEAITALTKAKSLDKHGETNARQNLKDAEEMLKKEEKGK